MQRATEHLMPGIAQVVAISVGHSDEGLDGIDVLLLHFCDARASRQQGEPRQCLHVCISLQLLPRQKGWRAVLQYNGLKRWMFIQQYLYGEDARYPDGTADPLQAQRRHLGVVTVLKTHAKSSQERRPGQLRSTIRMKHYLYG